MTDNHGFDGGDDEFSEKEDSSVKHGSGDEGEVQSIVQPFRENYEFSHKDDVWEKDVDADEGEAQNNGHSFPVNSKILDDIPLQDRNGSTRETEFNQRKKMDPNIDTNNENVHPAASKVGLVIENFFKHSHTFFSNHRSKAKTFFYCILAIAYNIYLIAAVLYWKNNGGLISWCDGVGFLLIITAFLYVGMFYYLYLKPVHGKRLRRNIGEPVQNFVDSMWKKRWARYMVYLILLGLLIAFIAIDTASEPTRLISIVGMVVLIFFGFIFSKYPSRVNWTTLIWGLSLQLTFGLLTLRWEVGRGIFECLGNKISTFLSFTDEGSSFVYNYLATGTTIGDVTLPAVFTFQVLSVIYFFSFIIQTLYYWGAMQWIVMKLGFLLQISMGTTACESINAAASIFVGMTESPLLIKPYIHVMTKSELHAIFTGGMATIAGSVMAAYISFGVSPAHLLTASVMSAPAALCYSKLFYPETEVSHTKAEDITVERGDEMSALDAATRGASAAISLVLNIVSNIIAFVACVAFLNAVLSWGGGLVGAPYLSFEWITSKVFIPLAWLMGVEANDCELVANLIGLKTIINEFVAYQKLGEYIKAGVLSERSQVIATYALCGFSNPGSIGIMIGGLSAMAPERRGDIASVAVRGFISACCACFLTACVAGVLL